jgi:hypothetical protein
VIERVIENWLTSLNERQYQMPFCQLLASEGEKILYVSTHGQLELGIDILSIDAVGAPRGYQLKQGDIAMSEWRKCQDEVVQLVESHPSNPALPSDAPAHKSFFVTNGTIKDPVLNAINQRNEAWKRRGYGPLTPVGHEELLARFRKAHGKYLPESPTDLKAFLELYTAEGQAPLSKESFVNFIETILPLEAAHVAGLDIRRATASAVLLTNYLTQNHVAHRNHWALFEAWVIAGTAVLSLAAKSKAPAKFWEYSFKLCEEQAYAALHDLCEECLGNTTLFTQGSPLSDGYVYGARMLILCGLIAAHRLAHIVNKSPDTYADFADEFLFMHWKRGKAWGESAVPFFVLTALALESSGKQMIAEGVILNLIRAICALSGPNGGGFPNPYWDAEKCLRLQVGLEPNHSEDFVRHSYTLQSLVHLLVRRWRRQALRSLWEDITFVDFASLRIQEPHEWLRWRSSNAVLDTRSAPQPQSWKALLEESEDRSSITIPSELEQRPAFLLFFLLVYQHRFQPDSVKLLDHYLL